VLALAPFVALGLNGLGPLDLAEVTVHNPLHDG
jgi:hypothetical protein